MQPADDSPVRVEVVDLELEQFWSVITSPSFR
jgi:hypothetical protein